MTSSTGVNPEILEETLIKVLTTISEAITNVTQHAYPLDHSYEYKHIDRFWVAVTANRDQKNLTVVIYDQGATIPITYPRLERTEKVKRFLRRAISIKPECDYQYDGTYIRAAMRFGVRWSYIVGQFGSQVKVYSVV